MIFKFIYFVLKSLPFISNIAAFLKGLSKDHLSFDNKSILTIVCMKFFMWTKKCKLVILFLNIAITI